MPVGQYEAARVLGYSKAQCFCCIIFPQVVKRILPSITNEVITLVKDTSLSFSLAYAEMFTIAKQIAAAQTTFIPFVVAAIFYYIFNLIVATGMEYLEKRLSSGALRSVIFLICGIRKVSFIFHRIRNRSVA